MNYEKRKILEKKIGANVAATPKVSVIMPAYNCARFIAETLDSALAQTFKDFEIIVVNDGSPDTEELEKVLTRYFDEIIYIKQKNNGTASARNTAISEAKGKFLAFLDSDDVWFPEYLESQLSELNKKNCDLIYADALLFGNTRNNAETFMTKADSTGAVTTENLINATCNVITSGTVAGREKVLEVGMFDENLPRIGMEDFDLWFRLAKSGAKLDYQKKVLLKYRVSPNSLSGSNVQRAERNIKAFDEIQAKYNLTASEQKVLDEYLKYARAEVKLETAKLELTKENYEKARENFREANEFFKKPKLSLIVFLLGINPKLVAKFFRKFRPDEFSFIAPTDSAE